MPCSAAERELKSLARLSLCCASASCALRSTVSARALVATLRHPQLHRRAAQPTEPVLHLLDVRWQHGTRTSRGTADAASTSPASMSACCLFAVELGEKLLDEDGEPGVGIGILDRLDGLLHHPAALTPHPATADVENLHGHLEFVGGERDDVGVGAAAEDDGLLLQRPPQRADVVAQPRRGLEVQLLRCRAHPILQLAHEPVGAPGEEVTEVFNDVAVLLGTDPPDARRRALVDVAEQAWPPDLVVPLEHPVRAGARRENPQQQVEGLADRPGVGVRTEVAHALAPGATLDQQPREFLVQRHGEHRV